MTRCQRGLDAVLASGAERADYDVAAETGLASRQIWSAPRGPGAGRIVVPVVICLWRRHEQLPRILTELASQSGVEVELHLWNNDIALHDHTVEMVESAPRRPHEVSLVSSPLNVGGFGRFYRSRELADRHPFVIFVDDDERLAANALEVLAGEHRAGAISSIWAWSFANRRDYYNRRQVGEGELAKYCGTGGMVCDTTIFRDHRLFGCPRKYWFCEDVWLSYFAATALSWSLAGSAASIEIVNDRFDQNLTLARRKKQMYRELNRRGGWAQDPR